MDFLNFLGFGKKASSKDVAVDRLKLVLVHDRANCSTKVLEMLKEDIFKVISNYMEIDEEELDIKITTDEFGDKDLPVLYANIPIKNMRQNIDKDQ
ncbi:MAG: cell division topological specificity factor MinE [Lachnospirales bacterium]